VENGVAGSPTVRERGPRAVLNVRIKHRELFRPFAPVILEEETGTHFTNDHPSLSCYDASRAARKGRRDPAPHMSTIRGRLQTIGRDQNLRYYLMQAFKVRTAVPLLLNRSFNENGPICCTPEEAVDAFARTKMDLHLVFCDLLVEKR
jgi:carbamoyltransferase